MAWMIGRFLVLMFFNNQQETDLGMVALVVDMDKVSLNGMAITEMETYGNFRTVTKSKGTLLYTIDNKPAIEMYF
ncbi:MAG: hypothetical protein IPQ27_09805 [Chitinophagaceae bacterium]|nr:hypothetical protein [Chitinophagaceae bacterium]